MRRPPLRHRALAAVPVVLVAAVALSCGDTPTGTGRQLEISAPAVTLYRNATFKLTAVVRGLEPAPSVVEWASLDPTVATVNDTGLVHAVAPGDARITATAGPVADTSRVTVRDDRVPPTVSEASISPIGRAVDVSSGAVTVTLSMRARDVESGVRAFRASIASPRGGESFCAADAPISGTSADGVWQCAFVLNQYAEPGDWIIQPAAVDVSGNVTLLSHSAVKTVTGSLPDDVPPTLAALTQTPGSVDVRQQAASIDLRVTLQDEGAGPAEMFVVWADHTGTPIYTCTHQQRVLQAANGSVVKQCSATIPAGSPNGAWTIRSIRFLDLRGNERPLTTAELTAGGFATTVQVTGQ